jgi:hypothetical protein
MILTLLKFQELLVMSSKIIFISLLTVMSVSCSKKSYNSHLKNPAGLGQGQLSGDKDKDPETSTLEGPKGSTTSTTLPGNPVLDPESGERRDLINDGNERGDKNPTGYEAPNSVSGLTEKRFDGSQGRKKCDGPLEIGPGGQYIECYETVQTYTSTYRCKGEECDGVTTGKIENMATESHDRATRVTTRRNRRDLKRHERELEKHERIEARTTKREDAQESSRRNEDKVTNEGSESTTSNEYNQYNEYNEVTHITNNRYEQKNDDDSRYDDLKAKTDEEITKLREEIEIDRKIHEQAVANLRLELQKTTSKSDQKKLEERISKLETELADLRESQESQQTFNPKDINDLNAKISLINKEIEIIKKRLNETENKTNENSNKINDNQEDLLKRLTDLQELLKGQLEKIINEKERIRLELDEIEKSNPESGNETNPVSVIVKKVFFNEKSNLELRLNYNRSLDTEIETKFGINTTSQNNSCSISKLKINLNSFKNSKVGNKISEFNNLKIINLTDSKTYSASDILLEGFYKQDNGTNYNSLILRTNNFDYKSGAIFELYVYGNTQSKISYHFGSLESNGNEVGSSLIKIESGIVSKFFYKVGSDIFCLSILT